MTKCLEDFFKKHEVEYYKNYSLAEISYVKIGGNADIVY